MERQLAGTAYAGLITRYNWTGGMKETFLASGLFSWRAVSADAARGDERREQLGSYYEAVQRRVNELLA